MKTDEDSISSVLKIVYKKLRILNYNHVQLEVKLKNQYDFDAIEKH